MNQQLQFKAWLVANGISQRVVAQVIGLSLSSTNSKINGEVAWLPQDLKALHDVYGLSADFVLGLSPYPYGVVRS